VISWGMSDDKMKSIELSIPPMKVVATRNIKKRLNRKMKAKRKTQFAGALASAPVPTTAKTLKRVVFKPEHNQTFEFPSGGGENISSLDELDVNFTLEPSKEFKIEEVPEISIAELFSE